MRFDRFAECLVERGGRILQRACVIVCRARGGLRRGDDLIRMDVERLELRTEGDERSDELFERMKSIRHEFRRVTKRSRNDGKLVEPVELVHRVALLDLLDDLGQPEDTEDLEI